MRRRALSAAVLLLTATLVSAQAAPTYTVGQAIEVREGDTWSSAKVTAHEGRRYQIQYGDGTQEWVAADRMRANGSAASVGDASKTSVAPQSTDAAKPEDTPTATPPKRTFTLGKSVEVKRGAFWKKGTIKTQRDGWYLVTYEGGHFSEWAEPWRVREFGSSYDLDGSAPSNPMMIGEKIDPPPTDRPGPVPAGGDEAALPGEPTAAPGEAIAISPVRGGAREAVPAIATWSYKPGPVAPSHATDRPIGIPSSGDFFDDSAALDVNGSLAMVGFNNGLKKSPPAAVIVNLGTGDPVARATFDPTSVPAAMSADGRRVFCKSDGKVKTRVDVWDINDARPRHVVSFAPYGDDFFKDVTRVVALDATHVLTSNAGKHLIVFEIGDNPAKAAWQLKLEDGSSEPFVSPDRRALAMLWNGNLMIVDAQRGESPGTIETSARSATSASFRGDGKRLALLDGPTLYEFELDAGAQLAAIGLPKAMPAANVANLANRDLFLSGAAPADSIVFDVDAGAIVGRYKLENARATTIAGDRLLASIKSIKSNKRWALCAWGDPRHRGEAERATGDAADRRGDARRDRRAGRGGRGDEESDRRFASPAGRGARLIGRAQRCGRRRHARRANGEWRELRTIAHGRPVVRPVRDRGPQSHGHPEDHSAEHRRRRKTGLADVQHGDAGIHDHAQTRSDDRAGRRGRR